MKVVIADDEEFMRDLVQDILLSQDLAEEANILLAENGLEAWNLIEKEQPDLLITDMMMPKLNGAELIEKIRDQDDNLEILVMTGFADLDMAVSVIRMNVAELIRKPFKPDEITNAIQKIIRRKELERENEVFRKKLIEAEKFSSIGLLSAGVAHEINNPNTFIRGNLDLLLKYENIISPIIKKYQPEDEAEQKKVKFVIDNLDETIRSAIDGSNRIRNIVSGLLSYSRSNSNALAPVLAKDLIKDALSLVSFKAKKHTVEVEVNTERKVQANHQEVVQTLMNLLVNSIDSLEEKHTTGDPGKIIIKVDDEEEYQAICVKDFGKGIEEKHLTKIFDPFFTTKPQGKGTGLGLSISKGNLEKNGSTLSATSKPGEWTEFKIQLPFASV